MSKKLTVNIKDVKSISELSLSIDLKPGLICFVGANGSGKSTILNVLSQVVEGGRIDKYFSDEKRNTSEIVIKLGDEQCIWGKVNNKWVQQGSIKQYKGFLESGVVYGNRFNNSSLNVINKYCDYYASFDEKLMTNASDFIVENLGKILKGNKDYYRGLKTLTKKMFVSQRREIKSKELECDGRLNQSKQKDTDFYLIRKVRPFLLLKDSGYITQYQMSSGEYLLLNILDYIYYRITYPSKQSLNSNDPFIIIIDEIEIALHPSSQKRLIQFCNEMSQKNNICIIFSTHSREIISSLKPEQILLIDSHLNTGKLTITTPCYPYYAIRGVYEAAGYDYIVCVEDELAKKIVTETIKKLNLSKNKRVNVLALGGWREVLRFANEFKVNGLFHNTKIVIVLDGDIKSNFYKEFGSPCRTCNYMLFLETNQEIVRQHCDKVPQLNKNIVKDPYPIYQDVTFLPISSLEKEVRNRIVLNSDYDLIASLNCLDYFGGKAVSELIVEYECKSQDYFSTENFKRKGQEAKLINFDTDGKILWRLLTSNLSEYLAISDLVAYFCNVLPRMEERTTDSWSQFEQNLQILLQKPA